MKRITITLTDEEYAQLERDAEQERRTVREMAAYLVAKKPLFRADWTWRPQPAWVPHTQIGSGTTTLVCQCGLSGPHNCTQYSLPGTSGHFM